MSNENRHVDLAGKNVRPDSPMPVNGISFTVGPTVNNSDREDNDGMRLPESCCMVSLKMSVPLRVLSMTARMEGPSVGDSSNIILDILTRLLYFRVVCECVEHKRMWPAT